jgi:hypothetical protein
VLNGLQNLDLVLLAEKSLHFFQCVVLVLLCGVGILNSWYAIHLRGARSPDTW